MIFYDFAALQGYIPLFIGKTAYSLNFWRGTLKTLLDKLARKHYRKEDKLPDVKIRAL